ncbi:MAG: polysaccharide biosynthesis protein [Streptosporangiaceae bacterium]
METVGEIIGLMRTAAPEGQAYPDRAALRLLGELTRSLRTAREGTVAELDRFLAVRERGLCLPEAELAHWLDGVAVLVTGGTGCIGSTLMAQLAARHPGRLVSLSRGVTDGWPRPPAAEYRLADIRDRAALHRVIQDVRPDVVFHVAAQRSPALAEVEVHRTVSTNVLGTRNVLAEAAAAGVPQVITASTGKALRPYSPEVYTASKRAAEWLASAAADDGMLCGTARFTHVLDNSIIYQRLLGWARDGVVRLHSPDIAFYVQSALESAHLLLVAGLGSRRGEFRVHAITDLGWPVSLLDLALGVLDRSGSAAPVYFSGYDRGYEEVPFPGLYDPATAGDTSPLLNAFETATVSQSPCPMVDASRLEFGRGPEPVSALAGLEDVCARTEDPDAVRGALSELSWSLLDAALGAAPRQALARAAALAGSYQHSLRLDHQRVLAAIQLHAGQVSQGVHT